MCPQHHVTHGELPGDPVVIAMVLDELRSAPTGPVPASVCG